MTDQDTSHHREKSLGADALEQGLFSETEPLREPLPAFDLGLTLTGLEAPPESKAAKLTLEPGVEPQTGETSAEHTDHEVASGAVSPATGSAAPIAGAHAALTGAPQDHAISEAPPESKIQSTVIAPPPQGADTLLGGSVQPSPAETIKTAILGGTATPAQEPAHTVVSQTSISPVAHAVTTAATAAPVPPGPAPTADQLNDVTFECGVDANGNVASPAFADYVGGTEPAQYDTTQDFASKWFNNPNDLSGNPAAASSTAGTASGTITYSFSTNVNATEQAAFKSALTLWSDEANVSFMQVPSTNASIDISFDVTTSGGSFSTAAPQNLSTVNTNQISSRNPGGGITFNDSGPFGTIGSYSASGGYGVGATVHEIGHAIGLGHSGPYNDGQNKSDPTVDQFNEYDSRQWSVMSYISPSAKSAFSNQYTVTGTQNVSPDGYQVAPQTPMFDDILSAQRLYGLSTSTTFSGGQTFGFNCNISDSAESFFDFTKNVNPFITLYDTGGNNTFDCSGFSTNCSINLNPGTFSTAASYANLTNNIGIAYGTKIDTAIGGSGDDTFTVNADKDIINGGGGMNTAIFSGARANYTIASVTGTSDSVVTNNTTGTADTLTNIQTLQFSDQSVPVVCYCAGTFIRTARGDVAVEALAVGDLAITATGQARAIRWLGQRTIDCRNHPDPLAVMPVRISVDAFGPNKPDCDLTVSPGHAICVNLVSDVLIPASALINGSTITRVAMEEVTYWHIELDSHDILIANGLPAESYIDVGNRSFFVESGAPCEWPDTIRPDKEPATLADYCRPFHAHGPFVEVVRAQLATRAAAAGWIEDRDASLYALVDGMEVMPLLADDTALFMFPADAKHVQLMSKTFVPADRGEGDTRRLGLSVSGLSMSGTQGEPRRIALDTPALSEAFHPDEREDGHAWRWTKGDIVLDPALWAELSGQVAVLLHYDAKTSRGWIAPAPKAEAYPMLRVVA